MENKKGYTKEQYEKAKQVSLVGYITSRYENFKDGNTIKLKEHDSFVLFPQTDTAYCFSQKIYFKTTIDFMVQFENSSIISSIIELSGDNTNYEYIDKKLKKTAVLEKEIRLPNKDIDNKKLFAYLTKSRGIDTNIVKFLVESGDIYQSEYKVKKGDKELSFSNCVFVGKDSVGNIKYASQRSTNTKGSVYKADVYGSNKSFPFVMKSSQQDVNWVNICESPIDCMSYASLDILKKEDYTLVDYLSLGGLSDKSLERYLDNNKNISTLNFCLDSDVSAKKVLVSFKEKYQNLGYTVLTDYPKLKDFNEDLIAIKTEDKINNLLNLPRQDINNEKVISYLTKEKGFEKDIVEKLIKDKKIYQSKNNIERNDKKYTVSSCVFINNDKTYGIEMSLYSKDGKTEYMKEHANPEKVSYILNKADSSMLAVFNNPVKSIEYSLQNKENVLTVMNMKNIENSIIDFINKNHEINNIKICIDDLSFKKLNTETKEYDVINYSELIYKKIERFGKNNDITVEDKRDQDNNFLQSETKTTTKTIKM